LACRSSGCGHQGTLRRTGSRRAEDVLGKASTSAQSPGKYCLVASLGLTCLHLGSAFERCQIGRRYSVHSNQALRSMGASLGGPPLVASKVSCFQMIPKALSSQICHMTWCVQEENVTDVNRFGHPAVGVPSPQGRFPSAFHFAMLSPLGHNFPQCGRSCECPRASCALHFP
jgi:hypothetical protein